MPPRWRDSTISAGIGTATSLDDRPARSGNAVRRSADTRTTWVDLPIPPRLSCAPVLTTDVQRYAGTAMRNLAKACEQVFHEFVRLLDATRCALFVNHRPFRWLYGFDLDEVRFGRKDGAALFTVLATFALAQGAALAQLARGEYQWLALGIYLLTFAITVAWIIAILRSRFASGAQRVYDQASIRYGRWVLSWVFLEGIVLVILAANQLLPYQTRRVLHETEYIATRTYNAADRLRMADTPEQVGMDRWVTWMRDSFQSDQFAFFWVQQLEEFQSDYYSFVAELRYDAAVCQLGQHVAFLVSVNRDDAEYRPVYRQIPFLGEPQPEGYVRLYIEEPNRGERIVVITYARKVLRDGGFAPPLKDDCDFHIYHPLGG